MTFPVLTLRQASFVKLRTGRANGLKNEPLTCLLRQAQNGAGQAGRSDWKLEHGNPKRLKMP
ncbi:MAG: hypothetical protein LBD67_04135 [Candidatus Accumulibacter sp.]|nr:hypothetical protein [Accumulibacter sp.]